MVRLGQFLTAMMVAGCCALCASASDAASDTGADGDRLGRLEKMVNDQADLIASLESKIAEQERTAAASGAKSGANALSIRKPFGMDIAVSTTGVVQGSVNGEHAAMHHDDDRDGLHDDEGDTADASLTYELEIQAPVGDRGLAYMMLTGGAGEGLTDNLDTFAGVNDAIEEDDIRVSELYYQHSFFSERLIGRAGMLDPSTLFDTNVYANNSSTQFLGDSLVNSQAIDWPDEESACGLDLSWAPVRTVSLSLGVYDGDSDWDNITDDAFAIAEVGLHPVFRGHPGNYRMYGWTNNDHQLADWRDGDNDLGWGTGLSFDQEFLPGFGAFARYGYADEHLYAVSDTWSAGLALDGRHWGRERDLVGLAVGQNYMSDKYRRMESATFEEQAETFFEIFYRWTVNDHLALSPDVQCVRNARGNADLETVTILGMRAQLDF